MGLAPVVGERLEILIVGSFPGGRSLAERAYYANPHNRLWPVLAGVIGVDSAAPYRTRLRALVDAGLGCWDVLRSCERRGSLDASIVPGTEVPNAFGDLVASHPELRAVLLNGATAARLFHALVVPRDLWPSSGLRVCAMPSTSPAHAAMSLDALAAAWHAAIAGASPRARALPTDRLSP